MRDTMPGAHTRGETRTRPSARLVAAVAAIAMLAAACGPASATAIAADGLERRADGWHGLPLERERQLPDVQFEDTDGEPFDLSHDLTGTPTLLFFGYSSCPDICPIHLAAIASAMDTAGVGFDELDVVFVSVDPERDSPEQIEDFLANFSSQMIGLHGDIEVVEQALGELDMGGPVVEGPDPRGDGDLIGHPAQVIGFDADGDAQRAWPFGARRSDWVSDLPKVVEEWS